jgi:signal transduction histidine kinase
MPMAQRDDERLAAALADVDRLARENDTLSGQVDDLRQELARFVYIASHDLRAPLRAIKSLAEWIAEDVGPDSSEETGEHLQLLRARVDRMDAYLVALLEYSRVGRMPVPVERVDAGALVKEVIADLEAPATMTFDVAVDGDVAPFETPRASLERVLLQVVGNAVGHHDRPDGRVEVRVNKRDGKLCFEVSDDGPGIAPKHHGRVFELFQTLCRRDEIGGCGMGLPLAKKIVETSGGSIELSSEGRGTTVRFTWPC